MVHLFRAVLLVADENVIPETFPVHELSDDNTHREMAAWLERLMPECRVLMVRTGDDAHLSKLLRRNDAVNPKSGRTVYICSVTQTYIFRKPCRPGGWVRSGGHG
ncbi:hypothetical protein F5Y14DRAFT_399802 [Nemania sp. NC0429]|nr:hypothetical protein F5Y14DRAFT_399802 [Nemania sp. NC0429]